MTHDYYFFTVKETKAYYDIKNYFFPDNRYKTIVHITGCLCIIAIKIVWNLQWNTLLIPFNSWTLFIQEAKSFIEWEILLRNCKTYRYWYLWLPYRIQILKGQRSAVRMHKIHQEVLKGAQSDFSNFWRFWYHKKAHNSLITNVKFHSWNVFPFGRY